ncbi:MAG: endogenous inhibitor of DNA gyrase (YacG/DUF329 family) [Ascidiaceihabitans sp.]
MSCPICAREIDAKFKPFCSKRCADVDLSRWINGSYAVASEREDEIDIDLDHEITKDLPH